MNADRVAGSGPGGLPLPPASTTRNVSLLGTRATAVLPPFFGRTPGANGQQHAIENEVLPEAAGAVASEPLSAAEPSSPEPAGQPFDSAALQEQTFDSAALHEQPLASVSEVSEQSAAGVPEASEQFVVTPEASEDPFAGLPETSEQPIELAAGAQEQPIDLAAGAQEQPIDPSSQADLSAWFTNGLGDVSLAAEGSEPDLTEAEPVFGADSSVPAELVFGVTPGEPAAEVPAEDAWVAEGEGVVEPVFEEDVHATEEMLAERARRAAEFPMDAFIIPEETRRLPTGVGANGDSVDTNGDGPASEIAERFEQLSRLLREEDMNALLARLARGDRLDALLAGFLAGYLSTHDA